MENTCNPSVDGRSFPMDIVYLVCTNKFSPNNYL